MKKRVIALFVASIMTILTMLSINAIATFDSSKDPNGDGHINIADYVYIVQYLTGHYILTDAAINQLDMNCNGVISIVDANSIIIYDSGGVLS